MVAGVEHELNVYTVLAGRDLRMEHGETRGFLAIQPLRSCHMNYSSTVLMRKPEAQPSKKRRGSWIVNLVMLIQGYGKRNNNNHN